MNVEIGTEAAQFPEKEFINRIFLAVWEVSSWQSPSAGNKLHDLHRCLPSLEAVPSSSKRLVPEYADGHKCSFAHANERTSEQANKRTSKQGNKRTSEQANHRTSEQADKETSEQANKQTSKQANKRTSEQANKRTCKQAAFSGKGCTLQAALKNRSFPF